jgi:hypothetical protein
MCRGNECADFGNTCSDVRSGLSFFKNGYADGPEKRVRQLERRGLDDVEAIDEAVTNQIQVAREGRTCLAIKGSQACEHLRGVALRFEHLNCSSAFGDRFHNAFHLVGATCRYCRRTAHESQQVRRRQSCPVPNVCQEIPDRQHRARSEAHVLGDHVRVVVAAPP